MKRTISVILASALCIILLGCKGKHRYTPIDIDSYITDDIDFHTENVSYVSNVTKIKCYFTYNGDEDSVYLSDPSNCFLIRKENEEWYKLELENTPVDLFINRNCIKGEEYISSIGLINYYELPLDVGTYRLVWDNYISDAFKIEERK